MSKYLNVEIAERNLKPYVYLILCVLVVQTEVNFLGQLRHPNLVKLIGYCCEDDHRMLLFEFMFRGSLENHLFRSTASFALSKQKFNFGWFCSCFV